MKNDLITVIIPAYNAQDFIRKSLESVFNQSYKNLDIIVVNDGSSDKTCEIVEEYNNVRLLHKKNGGLCSARNFGVKNARGKYVVLLDADDYYEPDFIMMLYSHTSERVDEIIMCDFLKNGEKESNNYQYTEVEGKEKIFDLFLHGGIYNRTVNKIYPIELIKNVSFPEGKDMLEDAYFTSHALEKCNKIIRLPYAGYNYIRHDGTYTRNHLSLRQLSSYHSNILEKDVYLSKYVSKKEYLFLSDKIINHIRNCLNALKDLSKYDILSKILYLLVFMEGVDDLSKYQKRFVKKMVYANTEKKIKFSFFVYTIFVDTLKNKSLYIRNCIRKIIKRKYYI